MKSSQGNLNRVARLQKLSYAGMPHEVGAILRKAIFEGVYEPGQQIFEAELAKNLHLSRGPVREALLRLERESLVHHIFNRGWFVIQLTPERVSEITSLRVALELAALKLARQHITVRELKRVQKSLERMIQAHERKGLDEAIQSDFDFHQEIWRMSRNQILEETLKALTTPYFAFFRVVRLREQVDVDTFRKAVQNHQDMVDFLAGDHQETAEQCIENHFKLPLASWNSLLELLQR